MITLMPYERVTASLPPDLLVEIDRVARNRSAFIVEAVRRELRRRRRAALRESLRSPHPETAELAETGVASWPEGAPAGDAADLLDPGAGTAVRWSPRAGWRRRERA
jgi:hypothetical protein